MRGKSGIRADSDISTLPCSDITKTIGSGILSISSPCEKLDSLRLQFSLYEVFLVLCEGEGGGGDGLDDDEGKGWEEGDK